MARLIARKFLLMLIFLPLLNFVGYTYAKVHPRLIGLTGSFDDLNAAAKAYKVSAKLVGWTLQKQPIVEHGSYIYLMGPDGEFLTIFPPIMDPEEMAAAIRGYLN